VEETMAKKVETKSVKTIQEKWARLRQVAAEDPKEADNALAEVADALGTMADSLTNLRENLDLIEVPKSASIKARIANARKYANGFRRMADEAPEVVADAISEVYHSLDDVAGALEHLAENMGIDLDLTPAEEAFGEEGKEEIAGEAPEFPFEEKEEETEDEEPEVKEASGSDNWVTDRNEEGDPKSSILASKKKEECSQCGEGHGKAGTKCERHGKLIPAKKKAGPIMEKFTPENAALTTTGPLGALRKLLYTLDGSENKYTLLNLVKETLNSPEAVEKVGKKEKKADGGAAFISDRDESAKPEAPEKLDIPEAQGESEVNKVAKLREATRQRIASRHGITL
jgi:hypothetical protein